MGYTDTARNSMLADLAAKVDSLSLHTGDPGTTGANEVVGGSPAYARKAVTWNSPAVGEVVAASQPVFDVPAGSTITHVGLWDGGAFWGSGEIPNEAFGSQGTYTLTQAIADLLA